MEESVILQRRLARETSARLEAEDLLEKKSRALFSLNQKLEKTLEETSAESAQLSVILNKTVFAILLTRADGSIVNANKTAEKFYQDDRENIIGQNTFDFLEMKTESESDSEELFTDSEPQNDVGALAHENPIEAIGTSKTGQAFPMEVTITKLDWGGGEHFMWLCRDLTRQKEEELQKRNLEQELRHAQKLEALGTLASGVAHEINTPIQFISDNISFMQEAFEDLQSLIEGMVGAIDTLDENIKAPLKQKVTSLLDEADFEFLEEEVPASIEQTGEGIKRVAKIVSAIKDYAHPGTEDKSAVNLNEAVKTTITVSKNQWKYVSNMELELFEDLPAFMGHVGDINQALLNLVVNAAHAIEENKGEDLGKITITTGMSETDVFVSVADTGCGIEQENIDRIFDPFFTTKEVGKGTGQGLSIIHNVVTTKHAGTVDVQSEIGQGSVFTLRFPKTAVANENAGEVA
ncbi:MAG: ATP-binding protein [Sneathiellales bacterium]|nr:ATP-binding protein [Sneathiellales bacterium]